MPFMVVAVICASGIATFSIWLTLPMLVPTRTVAENTTEPSLAVAETVVSPGPLPNT